MFKSHYAWSCVVACLLLLAWCPPARPQGPSDQALRNLLRRQGVGPLDPGPIPSAEKARLGQMLFFDKILSGNRDTACASCHHPALMAGDELSLSIGTMGVGLGPDREKDPSRPFVARNATEIFNRGSPEWTTMFWDARVQVVPGAGVFNPAGAQLPPGLDDVLAAQAMFPVTGRDEMRGVPGDPISNELCVLPDPDFTGMWSALMNRLMAIPEYRALFAAAYPHIPPDQLGFQHAANAISAFEKAGFTLLDSPWDRYLRGDNRALNPEARRGAWLFYGKAGCSSCHSGSLMTDQRFHNIAAPQVGPGKPGEAPLDFGRGNVTGVPAERFAFRTPPLRNVAATGPWMHDGAFTSLDAAVRHHLDPVGSLILYDASQLEPDLRDEVHDDPATLRAIASTLDPLASRPVHLSEGERDRLMAFLRSLTSPSIRHLDRLVPDRVPSGLPVDRFED